MRTKHTLQAINTIAQAFQAGDDIRSHSFSTCLAKFCRDSNLPTNIPRTYGLITALENAKREGEKNGATQDIYLAEVTKAFSIFWTKYAIAQQVEKPNSGQKRGLSKSAKKDARKAQKKANIEYMRSPDKSSTPPTSPATKYHTPPQSPLPATVPPAPVVPVPAPVVPVPAPVVPVPAPVVPVPAPTPASTDQNSVASKIYDAFFQRPALYIFLASSALGSALALALFTPFTLACTLTFVGATLASSTIMGGVAAKIYFDNHIRNSDAERNI